MRKLIYILLCISITHSHAQSQSAIREYLVAEFGEELPSPERIWINAEDKIAIKELINPSQIKLSYRYWQSNDKTVWILDEIGKERNITSGITLIGDRVEKVRVLVYRESRGGQVQNIRFTQQYKNKDMDSNLLKEIDSISGATLSVQAMNKQVKLALWLNSQINEN